MNTKLTINLEINNSGLCVDFDIINNTDCTRTEFVHKDIDNPATIKEVLASIKEELFYIYYG